MRLTALLIYFLLSVGFAQSLAERAPMGYAIIASLAWPYVIGKQLGAYHAQAVVNEGLK